GASTHLPSGWGAAPAPLGPTLAAPPPPAARLETDFCPPTQPPPLRRRRGRGFCALVASAQRKVHARGRVFPPFSRQNAALGANGGQKPCHRDAKAAGTGAAGPGYDLKPPKTQPLRGLSWPDAKPAETTTTRHFRSA